MLGRSPHARAPGVRRSNTVRDAAVVTGLVVAILWGLAPGTPQTLMMTYVSVGCLITVLTDEADPVNASWWTPFQIGACLVPLLLWRQADWTVQTAIAAGIGGHMIAFVARLHRTIAAHRSNDSRPGPRDG